MLRQHVLLTGRLTILTKRSTSMLSTGSIRIASQSPKLTTLNPCLSSLTQSKHPFSSSSSSSSKAPPLSSSQSQDDVWNDSKIQMSISHGFPDFIEAWNPTLFRRIGYGLCLSSVGSAITLGAISIPTIFLSLFTGGYWYVGLRDMKQSSHAIRRNYPVLGNVRYILEVIRPELRQYIVEGDREGVPFDRLHRAQVYQRAKNVDDTMPFGTRRNLYDVNSEWVCHSMFPTRVDEASKRVLVGGSNAFGCQKPYSASRLNISAMSYGALSDNAILALSKGARYGQFYHNTGEGGVSTFHRRGGGDLVWNIGTGYYGCGSGTTKRIFEPDQFLQTLDECNGQIKMIEIKLSQGAKPGHGGLLPKRKISPAIAEARKLPYPPEGDCASPPNHTAFHDFFTLLEFIQTLRRHSDGLPIGIKLCIGHPQEFASLCSAMQTLDTGPDFITVDGAEGGTGAAPPEFTNSIGLPLEEGLTLAHNVLKGANLRHRVTLIASGKITSGFALVKAMALHADVANSARGFMFSLGCIQALKCNTNKCPTGIATTDENLMNGLHVGDKSVRVANFQRKTLDAACHIVGAMGLEDFGNVTKDYVMRRVRDGEVRTLAEQFPEVDNGVLLEGTGPERLQRVWDEAGKGELKDSWIY